MTTVAITDPASLLTAVAGQRIPRRAWADVSEVSGLLSEATRVMQAAKHQSEQLQRRAYFDGRAAGATHAQAEAIKHIIEAQKQARDLVVSAEARIIELAVSIVARIVPRLGQNEIVAALAVEALAAIRDERRITVRVSKAAERATRTMLDRWQCAHPEIEAVDLVIDPSLDSTSCSVETELGRIEVDLSARLEAVRATLAGTR
jgi:type III secretion protein L